ncbi:unnamed protein product [Cochlearia groenlandica]
MRDKHRYKLSKLPRNSFFARVRNRCISTGRPRSVSDISRFFDGHKEIVLVATTKPIEQRKVSSAAGPQARCERGGNRSGGPLYRLCLFPVKRRTLVHWSAIVQRDEPIMEVRVGTEPSE